ncbi:MAG: hypothetical protein ABEH59_04075 [Halobacteriales archaeon]
MDHDLPSESLSEHWEDLEADLEATARELEADGWTTVTLHPGDVTTRIREAESDSGLDVMVADNEFDRLEAELEAEAEFGETAVFRRAAGGIMFLVFVLRDPDAEVAAVFPAFYPQEGDDARTLADRAHETGQLNVFVHPLKRDRVVTFTIEKPELVFPSD